MARYIDADFVSCRLREVLHGPKSEFPDDFEQAINCLVYAISILEFAPTADVEPVVHAFWFWTDDSKQRKELQCSNCGKFVKNHENLPYLEFTETFQYCPKCGAKMDDIYMTIRLEGR